MSKTVLVLFAACVGLSLLSLHLVKQMRAGDAKVAELQAQVAKLESERQNNLAPALALESSMQPEPVMAPPAPANKELMGTVVARPRVAVVQELASVNPSREERMRLIREARERQRQLMQDPDYREAMRVQQRSMMGRTYPGLTQELGLTTEQTEQFLDLLADQQLRNSEQAEMVWDTDNVDAATLKERQQKMQQRWLEMQQKNEAEMATLLGPDKVQAWKEYQSTLPARHQAAQLSATLASRGVALTEEANRAVVKAYAEAQKAEMQEYANMARAKGEWAPRLAASVQSVTAGGPAPEIYDRQLEQTKKRNQKVLEAVSPFLSYEQREALQKEQENDLKMQEAQIRIMRAQSSANGTNGWATNSAQAIILPDQ